jgi:AraC family transcriptional regulator
MNGMVEQVPVSTLDTIARLTGISPIWMIRAQSSEELFAALWKSPKSAQPLVIDNQPQSVLAYRRAGTPVVTKLANGRIVRKRPKIGAVTFVPGEECSRWSWDGPRQCCSVFLNRQAILLFAEQHLDTPTVPRIADFFGIEDPWLHGYFEMLISEYDILADDVGQPDSLLLDQTQHVLIRHLIRWHSDAKNGQLATLDKQARTNPLPPAVVRRVLEFIDANLTREFSLKSLAAVAARSPDHFLRSFRTTTGITPYRFVLDQRLRRATVLLASSGLGVSEVAAECGFRRPEHFSRAFRSAFGISPSTYRAKHGVAREQPCPLAPGEEASEQNACH